MLRALFTLLVALFVAQVAMADGRVATSRGETITLPKGCRQVIVVEHTSGVRCNVHILSYDAGEWNGTLVSGVTGYRGIANCGEKREGDGKTPAGVFELRRGFCYARDFVSDFPMEQYDERYMWDENPKSPTYNTLVRDALPETPGDRFWYRRDEQYRYIVVIEYNTSPIVAGAGSAIFIHAWRAEGRPTAGCIGLAESDVKRIVEWLNPEHNPHIVVLNEGSRLMKVIN